MKLWIGVALAAQLLAGAASAQTQTPPADAAPTRPEWVRKPSGQDIANALDSTLSLGQQSGWALMRCWVTAAGTLKPCRVIIQSPDPGKIGRVALKLAPIFRLKPAIKDGKPVDGGHVLVPIVIGSPETGTPRLTFSPGRPSFVLTPLTGREKTGARQMACPFDTDKTPVCEAREVYWTDTPMLEDTAPIIIDAQQATGLSTVFCRFTAAGRFETCRIDGEEGPGATKAVSKTLAKLKAPVLADGQPMPAPAMVALVYDWTTLTKAAHAILEDIKAAP
ncbi:hypothetical protein [Caulobacter sp. RHG1]|uniref:hypothetical protein n=1 Tax=Caulobacter sp. (strain RHG1) TaxID=2545762 RepID=UPI001553540B|nr:hypothetical protein [Caulobacter sp. RHG1]NQE61061.1 hypothetical protein [Caulobacter sp. RHG1]